MCGCAMIKCKRNAEFIMERAMAEKNIKKEQPLSQDLAPFYKSIIEQDRCAIVICNLKHEIIYMNPAAVINYKKRGGEKLIGKSLLDCHKPESREKIIQVLDWFSSSVEHNIVYISYKKRQNKDVYMVALRDGEKLIGYYEKHEFRNRETMEMFDLYE